MNFSRLHPSETALDEFAAGNPASSNQHRIVSHLERCQRCRNRVAFSRDLRGAVTALTAPGPPPDLLDRVLRDRAAGERVILPVSPSRPSARQRDTYRVAAAVVAVAGIALAVTYARRLPPARSAALTDSASSATSKTDTLPGLRELFSATVFLPGVASAQVRTTRAEELRPVAPQIDGTRMRGADLTYQRQYTDATGKRRVDGEGVLRIRPAMVLGAPGWRVERKWVDYPTRLPGSRRAQENETILLDRRTLRLIQRDVDVSPYLRYSRIAIAQKFGADSVFGRMMTEGGDSRGVGRPILQRLPSAAAPYISDAFVPLFFTSLRLGPDWHGRVSVIGWAVRDDDVYYPIELRVLGKDRVAVPAGTFDCWRLLITSGGRRSDYWVRVSDGLGVRSRSETSGSTPGVTEIVLVRSSP